MFATNLDPASLADEAFLRRIPYKVAVGDTTVDQFTRIFEMNCRARRIRFHRVMVAYLYRRHYLPNRRPLRACHPRDLLDQIHAPSPHPRVRWPYPPPPHSLPTRRPLRACHPRDLLDQITALCRYRGVEPSVTRELLDAACASYFVDGSGGEVH